IATTLDRHRLETDGKLLPLPEPSQSAADKVFLDTGNKLCDGLAKVIHGYAKTDDSEKKRIYQLWLQFADVPGWYNIRSMGQTQSFKRIQDHIRMSVSGKAEASCGWAYDLPEPIDTPPGARLVLDLKGTEGARFFIDVMSPEGKGIFQVLWQDTPRERQEVRVDLPSGLRVGQIILYTMNMGPDASNDFWRLAIEDPDQKALVSFFDGKP
ncbi:MAG: hypothetical protein HY318_02855, partial [Armatimonadetes bacterium]|nr:hypothetical protein [Armatimonadota bacterium]